MLQLFHDRVYFKQYKKHRTIQKGEVDHFTNIKILKFFFFIDSNKN